MQLDTVPSYHINSLKIESIFSTKQGSYLTYMGVQQHSRRRRVIKLYKYFTKTSYRVHNTVKEPLCWACVLKLIRKLNKDPFPRKRNNFRKTTKYISIINYKAVNLNFVIIKIIQFLAIFFNKLINLQKLF